MKRASSKGFTLLATLFIIAIGALISISIYKNYKSRVTLSPTQNPSPTPFQSPSTSNTPTPKLQTKATSTPSATPVPNNSSSQSSTTKTTTSTPKITLPTSFIDTTGATVSTSSLSVSMNRGETKNNLFSFTSTGATSYQITVNISPSISGLNYLASGGMTKGQTANFFLTVPSNASAGTYTGSINLTFQPGNIQKIISLILSVTNPSPSDMGFTFSSNSINLTAKNNGSVNNVFSFTSTGSTSFIFSISFNSPAPAGGGINYLASGGISNGQTSQMWIQVYQNVSPGTYTGTGLFTDDTKGGQKSFPVTIQVTN